MSAARLTVVVCTHDRPDDLRRCLAGLAEQTVPVEVVVVDSASSPPVAPVVAGFPGVRCVAETEPGLSLARNRGLAEASCELVAYLDDDSVPEPDWAERITEPFSDPAVVAVGGACAAAFDVPPPGWLSPRLLQFAGITDFGSERRVVASSSDYPFGGNTCYRKADVEAVGAFPLALGRNGSGTLLSGEETPVLEALLERGTILLEPTAVMHHRVIAARCEPGYYRRRLWWQGVSRARHGATLNRTLRLLAAIPIRTGLYAATRDRFYLYRLAESAGYLSERLRRSRVQAALPAALLLALALVVRSRQQRHGLLFPDGYQYLLMARGIAEHLTPTTVLGPAGDRFVPNADAAVKPLYPALVAMVHAVGGSWLGAARAVTAAGAGATAVLGGLLAARLTGSRVAGAAACALILASPATAYWSGFAGPDPVAQALALGAGLALVHRRPALAGVLAGLAVTTRPELAMLVLAGLGLAAVRPRFRAAAVRGGVACALTVGGVLALIRPPLELASPKLLLLLPLALAPALVPARLRLPAILAAVAVAAGAAAGGAAPGLVAVWHQDWPLLVLGLAGLAAAARADDRTRDAVTALAAAAVALGGAYWLKNPNVERYIALLLPLAAIAGAVGLAALAPRLRGAALGAAAAAIVLGIAGTPTFGTSDADMFSTLAPRIARAAPAGPLLTAAPEAYGFWLPHRTVRALRPGTRGVAILDATQRAYAPHVRTGGPVVARIADEIGFVRPDGELDVAHALVVDGRYARVKR